MSANKGPDPLKNYQIDYSDMPPVLIEDIIRDRGIAFEQMNMAVKACADMDPKPTIYGRTAREWCQVITRATIADTDDTYIAMGER